MSGDPESGQGKLGLRHFLSSSAASYLSQVVGIVQGLVVLPIGVSYFGLERFGVWLVILSIITYLNNGSLGMPLASLTAISHESERGEQARIAAKGIRIIVLSAVGFAVLLGVVWRAYPAWLRQLFGSTADAEVAWAVGIAVFGTVLALPFTLFPAVLGGMHRVVAQNSYTAARSAMRVAAVVTAVLFDGDLVMLAVLTVLGEIAVGLSSAVHVTWRLRLPVARYLFDLRTGPPLAASGLRFFALQIEFAVIQNTDNLVISAIIGTGAVTVYVAPFRALKVISSLIGGVQGPLWPAYGSAYVRRDWDWIRRAHRAVTSFGLALGGLAWVGAVLTLPTLIALWLGPDFPVDQTVVFLLGAYTFVFTFVSANAILLNAMDATQSQIYSGAAEAAVNLTASVFLAQRYGIAGVAAGTLIGATVVSSWYLPLDIARRTAGEVSPRLAKVVTAASYTLPLAAISWVARRYLEGGVFFGTATLLILVHLGFTYVHHRHAMDLSGLQFRPAASTSGPAMDEQVECIPFREDPEESG